MSNKLSYIFLFTLLFPTVLVRSIQSQTISGSWTTASSENFSARAGATASAVNGKIYVIGGNMHQTYWDDVQVYDPSSDTWQAATVTGGYTPRADHTASVVNGKIYIIGGNVIINSTLNTAKSVEMFDPLAGTWTVVNTTGSFIARRYHCDAVIGEKIYIFGGDTLAGGSGNHFPDNYIEALDLSTNTWSVVPTSGSFTQRALATSTVINGKVYIIGGENADGVLNTEDVFDPATNSWSQPDITGNFDPRAAHCAGLIDGKIFIAAGADIQNTKDVAVFDPAKNEWGAPPLISGDFTPRFAAASCVINNKFYVIGGYDDNTTPLDVNEVLAIDKASVTPETYSSAIAIFPNPSNGIFHLELTDSQKIQQIVFFDILGRRLFPVHHIEGDMATFDVRDFPDGTYFVQVEYRENTDPSVYSLPFMMRH